MIKQIELSIIIVNYNTRQLTDKCIDSICRTADGILTETICIDNASSDGSAEHLRNKYKDLILLVNHKNAGFAAACNQGMAISRGKYLLLLNSDTIMLPKTLAGLLKFFEQMPKAGAIGPRIINSDGSPQISFEFFPDLGAYMLSHLPFVGRLMHKRASDVTGHNLTQPTMVDFPAGACFMVRREVYLKVGGLDERYHSYFEDADWGYRIRKAGWEEYIVPEFKIIHLGGQSWKPEQNIEKLFHSYRSRYIYFRKFQGEWAVISLWVMVLLPSTLKWLGYSAIFATTGKLRNRKTLESVTINIHWKLLF